jgi:hypothetical protein
MSEVRVRGSMVSFGTSAKTGDSESIQQDASHHLHQWK